MPYSTQMGRAISFTVLGTVVPKQSFRKSSIHNYTDKKVTAYAKTVRAEAGLATGAMGMLKGQIECNIDVYFKIPVNTSKKQKELMSQKVVNPIVRPDFDNLAKNICDACNGIVYEDDSYIVRGTINKYYDDTPRAEITFTERKVVNEQGEILPVQRKSTVKSKRKTLKLF